MNEKPSLTRLIQEEIGDTPVRVTFTSAQICEKILAMCGQEISQQMTRATLGKMNCVGIHHYGSRKEIIWVREFAPPVISKELMDRVKSGDYKGHRVIPPWHDPKCAECPYIKSGASGCPMDDEFVVAASIVRERLSI